MQNKFKESVERKRSLYEKLFVAFDSEELMLAYYKERKHHSTMIFGMMAFARIGHLAQTTQTFTWNKQRRWESSYLTELYPDTPLDNARYL